MESNHRFLDVNQASSPLDHRTLLSSGPTGNRTRSASFKGSRRAYAPERVSCGSRTRLARLEAWNLCRSAKGTCRQGGRRESRTLKAYRSTAFEAAAVANRLALPFSSAAEAGIEPATKRLTVAFPYQHRTHRIISVRTAGFEPAISCFRNTRDTKLPHVLFSRAPSGSRTRTSAMARQ